jgi:hypothetical protein
MADEFTLADIQEAAKALEAANVPPIACPNCGAKWYAHAPEAWQPGDPVTIQCTCLAVLTVGGVVQCGGCLLGKGR